MLHGLRHSCPTRRSSDLAVRKEDVQSPVKSIGNSTTTPRDLVDDNEAKLILYLLAESVATRLRESGFRCRVIEISIRDTDLVWISRQRKIERATDLTDEIALEAYALFRGNYNWRKPIRSLGVRGSDLVSRQSWEQWDLFSDQALYEKRRRVDAAVDNIRERYGFYSLQRGMMLPFLQTSSIR